MKNDSKERKEIKITHPKQLIVEGNDEENIFEKLLNLLNISDIQIQPIGGKEKISSTLRTLLDSHNYNILRSIGIIIDADTDYNAAFDKVKGALKRANLPVPNGPLEKASNGKIEVSVFIMPKGNNSNGAIENLFVETINDKSIYKDCIMEFLDCAEELESNMDTNKAPVYAYISVQKEPDIRLGVSVQKGYWDLTHHCFDEIKDFLNSI